MLVVDRGVPITIANPIPSDERRETYLFHP
jgi:hypothetical protein